MSEREVRKKTRAYIERILSGVPPTSIATEDAELDLEQALSEPPDVVVLLREMRRLDGEHFLDDWTGTEAWVHIANYIERQFHVRLTADGWEWVEEGE